MLATRTSSGLLRGICIARSPCALGNRCQHLPEPGASGGARYRADAADDFIMEPPAFQLHWWNGQRLVTHTEYIGDFGPPHPFRESGKLID